MGNNEYKAKIFDIEKKAVTTRYIKQGIKGDFQPKYDNSKYHHGSNGTYAYGHESLRPELLLKMVVYDFNGVGNHESLTVDIYDYVLQQNGFGRLSDKALQYVTNKNKGKNIRVDYDGELHFDRAQIEVVPD